MDRTPLDGTHLRAVRDEDSDSLVALIAGAYAEYPGCVLDLPGVDADLVQPATTAAETGSRWWVLERDGAIVGSIGVGPVPAARRPGNDHDPDGGGPNPSTPVAPDAVAAPDESATSMATTSMAATSTGATSTAATTAAEPSTAPTGPADEHGAVGTVTAPLSMAAAGLATVELKRCYLAPDLRGRGLATRLIARVEEHARGLGAVRVELWSDSRFTAGHSRYASLGYVDTGARRHLDDPSDTLEHHFVKELSDAEAQPAVVWDGPDGPDNAISCALPDGGVVRGSVASNRYLVEVDHAWRPRRVVLASQTARTVLTSDGDGRWWLNGTRADHLDGCTDAALDVTPASIQPPIRRLGLGSGDAAEVVLAYVAAPDGTASRASAGYRRSGVHSYLQTVDGRKVDIEVDGFGLPTRVGDQWSRREA